MIRKSESELLVLHVCTALTLNGKHKQEHVHVHDIEVQNAETVLYMLYRVYSVLEIRMRIMPRARCIQCTCTEKTYI